MMHDFNSNKAIEETSARIDQAYKYFNEWCESGEEFYEPSWPIQSSFIQLIALSESLHLNETTKLLIAEYHATKNSKSGFSASSTDPDGDVYSTALSRVHCYFEAIRRLWNPDSPTVSKDLLEILRGTIYPITNLQLFNFLPRNENDVHLRIEGILKPIFSDLKHKPTLTKPIKNFEPDTGIPSISTLIEYKFITKKQDAPRIADEILADTRGYKSRDWNNFIYVIYETTRCNSEKEWNFLLKESGAALNTKAIVLCGEPHKQIKPKR